MMLYMNGGKKIILAKTNGKTLIFQGIQPRVGVIF